MAVTFSYLESISLIFAVQRGFQCNLEILILNDFLFPLERVGTDTELISEMEPKIKEDIHGWFQVMNANSQPLQLTNSPTTCTQTVRVTTLINLCSEVAQDLITVHLLYPQVCTVDG